MGPCCCRSGRCSPPRGRASHRGVVAGEIAPNTSQGSLGDGGVGRGGDVGAGRAAPGYHLLRHPPRHGHGGNAARLGHGNDAILGVAGVHQVLRDLRGFARPGLAHAHDDLVRGHGLQQLVLEFKDGELLALLAAVRARSHPVRPGQEPRGRPGDAGRTSAFRRPHAHGEPHPSGGCAKVPIWTAFWASRRDWARPRAAAANPAGPCAGCAPATRLVAARRPCSGIDACESSSCHR